MYYGAHAKLFRYAKEMRLNPTQAEDRLWNVVKQLPFSEFKFRRQHPISKFIADFYSHQLKLVIEIDGGYHLNRDQMEFDSFRDDDMKQFGILVLRFSNDNVLNDTSEISMRLEDWIKERAIP